MSAPRGEYNGAWGWERMRKGLSGDALRRDLGAAGRGAGASVRCSTAVARRCSPRRRCAARWRPSGATLTRPPRSAPLCLCKSPHDVHIFNVLTVVPLPRLYAILFASIIERVLPARRTAGRRVQGGSAAVAERLFPILYLELNAVGLTILLIVLFSQQTHGARLGGSALSSAPWCLERRGHAGAGQPPCGCWTGARSPSRGRC